MKKLFYLIAVLFMVSCNQNEPFEESSNHFRSLEEFNAFINEAVNESSALRTRAIDNVSSSSISPMECIKKTAIAKGLEFEVINEGTENEIISFASDDPNIRYETITIPIFLYHDSELAAGGWFTGLVFSSYLYDTISQRVMEVCNTNAGLSAPPNCWYFKKWEIAFVHSEVNMGHTGIIAYWAGRLFFYNPTTERDEPHIYSKSQEVRITPFAIN